MNNLSAAVIVTAMCLLPPYAAAQSGMESLKDISNSEPAEALLSEGQMEELSRLGLGPLPVVPLEAGPIWNNDDARGKCPRVADRVGGIWNGHWVTTVQGQMSVCAVQLTRPVSVDIEAGPIWNNADAARKCAAVADEFDGQWTGNWVTTVPGAMSVCNIRY